MKKLVIPVVVVAVLLAGCAGFKTDKEAMTERARDYVAAHPKLAPRTAASIRSNEIHAGMTMEQVVAAWGRPEIMQKFQGGAVQYWCFGCHWPHICTTPDRKRRNRLFPEPDELYQFRALFRNGKLVEWQN